MIRNVFVVASLTALMACGDGQPFVFTGADANGDGTDTTDNGIPEAIGNNVEFASFNPTTGDFTVQITSLDSTPSTVTYTRAASLDVPGYTAYSQQEDVLDRFFVAIAAESTDGTSTGMVIIDGGQFNKFFGGVYYEQNGSFSAPSAATGLVSYAGEYAGLTNLWVDESHADNLTIYDPTDPTFAGIDPLDLGRQPGRVTGTVFINADFTDNTVNGSIRDRFLIEHNAILPDVILTPTVGNIDPTTGAFSGTVENEDQDGIGDYAGVFGGSGATSISGGIHIESYLDDFDAEQEYGVFVLTQCGQPGDAAICDLVNP